MSSSGAEVTQVVSTTLVGRDEIVAAQFIFRCDGPFAVSAVFTAGARRCCGRSRESCCVTVVRAGRRRRCDGGPGWGRVTLTLSSASGWRCWRVTGLIWRSSCNGCTPRCQKARKARAWRWTGSWPISLSPVLDVAGPLSRRMSVYLGHGKRQRVGA